MELIADPNVTAVYIATPPGSHRDLALEVSSCQPLSVTVFSTVVAPNNRPFGCCTLLGPVVLN